MFETSESAGQERIINVCGPPSDEDGVMTQAQAMSGAACLRTRDPSALAGRRRDPAIEGRGDLEGHEWPAGGNSRGETGVKVMRLLRQGSDVDIDSGLAQTHDSPT